MKFALLILSLCCATTFVFAQRGYPRTSPFEDIRPKTGFVEVQVGGTWYRLKAIESKSYEDIAAFCHKSYGERQAWDRFTEDLPQVLTEMGLSPGEAVTLDLLTLDGSQPVTLASVKMTKENRRALLSGNKGSDRGFDQPGGSKKGRRDSPSGAAGSGRRTGENEGRHLIPDQVAGDLEYLQRALRERYSYLDRGPKDWEAQLLGMREAAGESMQVNDLHLRLREFMAAFGDGHTRARGVEAAIPGLWLPLSFVRVREGLAVYDVSGALLDPDHPLVVSIDDRTIEQIELAVAPLVTRGSPSLRTLETLRFLPAYGYWARDSEPKPRVKVITKNAKGEFGRRDVELWPARAASKRRPTRRASVLDGKIGYLPIPSMSSDDAFIADLHTALDGFSDAKGIVIDLRGNGGGSRRALVDLLPRFMPQGQRLVVNAGIYRLGPNQKNDPDQGHLSDRYLWPVTASHWSAEDRGFLEAFAAGFQPEWQPRHLAGFSDLHLMMLVGQGGLDTKPVVLLIDEGCFSATDIFVGAFAELPQVRLVGEATAGGSGRATSVQLPMSGIQIKLSSMVSWRPDGRLYDGRGIVPDRLAEDGLADWQGSGDSQLDAALAELARK
ncbi:MAG: hypothetical protein KDB53_09350 [Planctomycetes bacterium]|nr:hypothetical protein [Planctomycetota bacterium]